MHLEDSVVCKNSGVRMSRYSPLAEGLFIKIGVTDRRV